MKRKFAFLVAAIGLIVAGRQTVAVGVPVDIDFTSDGVIQKGDMYGIVRVYDTPPARTTVNMTDGVVINLNVFDCTNFVITGGVVVYLQGYNSSTIDVWGGSIGTYGQSMNIYDSTTLNVYGGLIGAALSSSELLLHNTSTLKIDMAAGGIPAITVAMDSSIVNLYRGQLTYFNAGDSSTLNIYGGEIPSFWAHSSATVNVYGTNFLYNPHWWWADDNPIWGTGWVSKLTAIGVEGVPIEIHGIADPATSSNIHLIPEPGTLMLMGIGGCVVLGTKKGGRERTSRKESNNEQQGGFHLHHSSHGRLVGGECRTG